ncbi:MAG: metallopeptidase family protein [Actinomycetes bacterium]
MAIEVDRAHFEALVARALDTIPPKLAARVVNVAVLVKDEPPRSDPNLLGLYEGIPLTERGSVSYAGVIPDSVTIFRGPICRMCSTVEEVVEEVRITVVHELGHYFGIDDDRLHELGY